MLVLMTLLTEWNASEEVCYRQEDDTEFAHAQLISTDNTQRNTSGITGIKQYYCIE